MTCTTSISLSELLLLLPDSQVLSWQRNERKTMSIHSPKPHDGPTALWSADNPLCFLSARMAETNVPPPARLQVHHILSLFLFLFFFYRHSKMVVGVLISLWARGLEGRPCWPFQSLGQDNDILMAAFVSEEEKTCESREPIIHHASWHHYLSISCRPFWFCLFFFLSHTGRSDVSIINGCPIQGSRSTCRRKR